MLKDIKYPENFIVNTIKESIVAIEYVEKLFKREYGIEIKLQFLICSHGIITITDVTGPRYAVKSKTSPARFTLHDMISEVGNFYESDIRDELQRKIIKSFTQKTLEELEEIWEVAKIELIVQGE